MTYVIDIGIRGVPPLPDVVIDLPVQRGFKVTSVPEYCGDGSFLDEIGLLCRVGELEQDRYFTRTVDMTAGPKAEADGLPIAVVVSARGGIGPCPLQRRRCAGLDRYRGVRSVRSLRS